jgi:hypothetical protein
LPETELQDDDFAREQSYARAADFARDLMEFDNNIRRLEQERAQIVSDIANERRDLNQLHANAGMQANVIPEENNNRFLTIATLVCGCAITAYYIISTTAPLVIGAPLIGGDNEINETNKEIDRSNGIGVIYIGYSEGMFGLWWSTIQKDGTILNILINTEEQYKKLLETYKFTTKPEINIATQILEVAKLNKKETKKGGSRNKRKMKRRSSRRKR